MVVRPMPSCSSRRVRAPAAASGRRSRCSHLPRRSTTATSSGSRRPSPGSNPALAGRPEPWDWDALAVAQAHYADLGLAAPVDASCARRPNSSCGCRTSFFFPPPPPPRPCRPGRTGLVGGRHGELAQPHRPGQNTRPRRLLRPRLHQQHRHRDHGTRQVRPPEGPVGGPRVAGLVGRRPAVPHAGLRADPPPPTHLLAVGHHLPLHRRRTSRRPAPGRQPPPTLGVLNGRGNASRWRNMSWVPGQTRQHTLCKPNSVRIDVAGSTRQAAGSHVANRRPRPAAPDRSRHRSRRRRQPFRSDQSTRTWPGSHSRSCRVSSSCRFPTAPDTRRAARDACRSTAVP